MIFIFYTLCNLTWLLWLLGLYYIFKMIIVKRILAPFKSDQTIANWNIRAHVLVHVILLYVSYYWSADSVTWDRFSSCSVLLKWLVQKLPRCNTHTLSSITNRRYRSSCWRDPQKRSLHSTAQESTHLDTSQHLKHESESADDEAANLNIWI